MKQEPVKNWKLPKYAAVLAALTVSGGMLTGCGDELALGGAVAIQQTSETAICTDVSTNPETETTATESPEESSEPLMLDGDVDVAAMPE